MNLIVQQNKVKKEDNCMPIYVLGGGGHAKVVIDSLLSQGLVAAGILDPMLQPGTKVLGLEILGGDDVLNNFAVDEVLLANGVGATPKNRINTKLFKIWHDKGFRFVEVRHSSAIISSNAEVDEGAQIMAGVIVQPGAVIREGVVLNTGARIDHDCIIGQHCFIAPSVTMCGGVKVGEHTFIGAGAVILPGVHVGKNTLIGANAVVENDVPDGGCILRS